MSMVCSFCGKSQEQVVRMVVGPGVNICNECVDVCYGLLHENIRPVDIKEPVEQSDIDVNNGKLDIDFIDDL